MEPTTGHMGTSTTSQADCCVELQALWPLAPFPVLDRYPSFAMDNPGPDSSAAACTFFAARFDTRKNVAPVASLPAPGCLRHIQTMPVQHAF